jgi:hypothetical protein
MKVDYSKGFIYKLCCLDTNITEIYVGCSTDYKSRKQSHKRRCCNETDPKHHYKVYQFIRANGGWENWRMILLHDFPCNSKRELEQEETKMMIKLKSELNDRYSFQTEEIKRASMDRKNKQKKEKLATDSEYREKLNKQKRESYHKNSEEILKKQREKLATDPEYREKRNKQKRDKIANDEEYREKLNKQQREKYHKNSEKINEKKAEKIECEFCHSIVTRGCLKRHQTTAKYCIEIQNK